MKRIARNILLAVLAAGLGASLAGLAACGGHVHSYGNYEVYRAATCTGEGILRATCSCGKYLEKTEPALGHLLNAGEETEPATCTEPGVFTRRCTREGCGHTETTPTEALGHDWSENVSYAKRPSCEEDGIWSAGCSRCDAVLDNAVAPALGHDMKPGDILKAATCTEDGEQEYRCARDGCNETETRPLLATGHDFSSGWDAVTQEATCEETGKGIRTCLKCNETFYDVEVPALGHDWEAAKTIDRAPTFETEGEKSVHCTRCSATKDRESIPKLDENTATEYVFRLVRADGSRVRLAGVNISVKDEGGKDVAFGTLSGGIYRASLLPKAYTVTVSGLPDGYAAETEYTLAKGEFVLDIVLRGSVIEKPMPANYIYTAGLPMYDFRFTALKTDYTAEQEITLSGLLTRYRAVLLNFFYVDCQWCGYEFPGMAAAYADYADDIAVIAITVRDSANATAKYANDMRLPFYFVAEGGEALTAAFKVGTGRGNPTTVIIDKEGVVSYIHDGALVEEINGNYEAERLFGELFGRYVPKNAPAMLPAKREEVTYA